MHETSFIFKYSGIFETSSIDLFCAPELCGMRDESRQHFYRSLLFEKSNVNMKDV